MPLLALLLIQSAPDIEISATVRARSLVIEKQGTAELVLTSEPKGENQLVVEAPRANGRKRIDNPRITIRGEARIAGPEAGSSR